MEDASSQELALACRYVPSDRSHRAPGTREFQVSSQHLEDADFVHNNSELFAIAVSLFPLLDIEIILEAQHSEFCPYIEYAKAHVTVPIPNVETKNSMDHYYIND